VVVFPELVGTCGEWFDKLTIYFIEPFESNP
jgi:hypothetical protein